MIAVEQSDIIMASITLLVVATTTLSPRFSRWMNHKRETWRWQEDARRRAR